MFISTDVATVILKPITALKNAVGNNVIVELKGHREYRGILDGYDMYMNVVLKDAEGFYNGKSVGKSATVIVRGDNVIYISP